MNTVELRSALHQLGVCKSYLNNMGHIKSIDDAWAFTAPWHLIWIIFRLDVTPTRWALLMDVLLVVKPNMTDQRIKNVIKALQAHMDGFWVDWPLVLSKAELAAWEIGQQTDPHQTSSLESNAAEIACCVAEVASVEAPCEKIATAASVAVAKLMPVFKKDQQRIIRALVERHYTKNMVLALLGNKTPY